MEKPEIGDVLILNGGGPEMTVSGVETFPKHPKRVAVTCVWHSGGGEVLCASFEDLMLRPRTKRDAANEVSGVMATSIERDRWVPLVRLLLDQLDASCRDWEGLNTSMLRALCDSPLTGLTSPTEEP